MPTNDGKPKHCPGPWSWSPDDNEIEGGEDGCSIVCYVAEHANVRTVRRTGQEFSHADARLIAAAPEMLALLREISRYHDLCSDRGGCLNAKARVLVKRIDGET